MVIKWHLKSGKVSHEKYVLFQWNWHPVLHLVVRISLTMYITVTMIYYLANGNMNLLYLTTWCYIVLTLHLLLSTTLAIYGVATQTDQSPTHSVSVLELTEFDFSSSEAIQMEMVVTPNNNAEVPVPTNTSPQQEQLARNFRQPIRCLAVLSWTLSDVIFVFALMVTLMYWSIIHPSGNTSGASALTIYKEVNVHALNSVFVIIEELVSARPVRLLRFIYPTIFGGIYTMFALMYWLEDKENHVLYSILNFNKPEVAGFLCLLVIGIFILHLVHYGLHRFKLFLTNRLS
ncbi:hypothetical protein FSP39_011545 [Pinctada imbricata]|uniref:Protein rolling stone n=1 Tax=Pinctada imbricata TaxID=66713 RepID=A0AA88YCH0_PINIB|nr:hypothetical protein FSP39_011545 [Pinctada imbricata]